MKANLRVPTPEAPFPSTEVGASATTRREAAGVVASLIPCAVLGAGAAVLALGVSFFAFGPSLGAAHGAPPGIDYSPFGLWYSVWGTLDVLAAVGLYQRRRWAWFLAVGLAIGTFGILQMDFVWRGLLLVGFLTALFASMDYYTRPPWTPSAPKAPRPV